MGDMMIAFFEFVLVIILVGLFVGAAPFILGGWILFKLGKYAYKRITGKMGEQPRIDGERQSPPPPQSQPTSTGTKTTARGQTRRKTEYRSAHAGKASSYVYFDVDENPSPDAIRKVMLDYVDDRILGEYARDIIDSLDTVDFRRKSLFSEINDKFEESSISWDRFAATASEALDAVVRNCALLANRVQAFDSADYDRMERFAAAGASGQIGAQNSARAERWRLLQETKAEMDGIRATNDGLLLELSKLANEIGKLSQPGWSSDNDRILEEVRRLSDETKLYR